MQSQNGWPAGERATLNIVTLTVPGTKTKLPVLGGDVGTVLLWVATRWHNEIEPLVEPGNWGYAYRAVRGATTGLSNHASGTAIDLNAPAHPLGTEPLKTMTKAQVETAKRIEADSGGVIRWGGSYTGRKDPMHWEINASPARVAALAARIRGEGGKAGGASTGGFLMALTDDQQLQLYMAVMEGNGATGRNNFSWLADRLVARIDALESRLVTDQGPDRLRDLWLELKGIREDIAALRQVEQAADEASPAAAS